MNLLVLAGAFLASGGGDLPDYPQIALIDLADPARDAAAPFVVVGTVATAADDDGTFTLSQTKTICCSIHLSTRVRVRLDGLEPTFEADDWVGVFGRLGRVAGEPPRRRGVVGPLLVDSRTAIDAELIVPAERLIKRKNMVELLETRSTSIFARAVREAGLTDELRVLEPITVLAPVDHAFRRLGDDALETLFLPEQRERLRLLVLGHVVRDRLLEDDLRRTLSITTLTHAEIDVSVSNGAVRIAGERTLFENRRAANGVLHIINTVLVPDEANQANPD